MAESTAAPTARAAAWRALEAIGDGRAMGPALRALDDPDPLVAEAATAVARVFVRGDRGAEAVDRLAEVALDRARPERVRAAALGALEDLERSTVAPLVKALAEGANPAQNVPAFAAMIRDANVPILIRQSAAQTVVA